MKTLVKIAGLSIFLSGALALPAVAQFGPNPKYTAQQIGGIAFQDFNQNGVRDENEPGVYGLKVSAFDSVNKLLAESITNQDGIYLLDVPTESLRLELSEYKNYERPGPKGIGSFTSVVFTTPGTCDVDFAISYPATYCDNNPPIAVPIHKSGDPLANGTSSVVDALVAAPYSASGNAETGSAPKPQTIAKNFEVGTTWGLAYQKSTSSLFAAAFLKRHAGLGSLGTGGIYKIELSDPDQPIVSDFVDLQTLGIDTGVDPRQASFQALPANLSDLSYDIAAFDAVGKVGLGDLDISEDERTLWAINLAQRSLVSIEIGLPANQPTSSEVSSFEIPNPGCSNDDYVPFALKIYRGHILVGLVCTAETSQNPADLKAFVLDFDHLTFETIFAFDLNYKKGFAMNPLFGSIPNSGEFASPWIAQGTLGGLQGGNAGFAYVSLPQLLLSSLEIDNDGALVLGFSDRSGHQLGDPNYAPITGSQFIVSAATGGDILRACPIGMEISGLPIWTLESNATCANITTGGSDNMQGPGGGEYYFHEKLFASIPGLNADVHQETGMGALTIVPGSNEMIATLFDIFSFREGGLAAFENKTGVRTRGYVMYDNTTPGAFGKAHGLGDLEALCPPAPIEIGNRIWLDSNHNGIQDAGESPIVGVTVSLYETSSNTLHSTVQSDTNGEYYFGKQANLSQFTQYLVKLDNASDFGQSGPLNGLVLTQANATSDLIDSDAIYQDGIPVIAVQTNGAGENDHSLDFGFQIAQVTSPTPTPEVLETPISCTEKDFSQSNFILDGSALKLLSLTKSAIKATNKNNSCQPISNKKQAVILKLANELYMNTWQLAWSNGTKTQICDSNVLGCNSIDLTPSLTKIQNNTTKMAKNIIKLTKKSCNAHLASRFSKRAKKLLNKIHSASAVVDKLSPVVICK